MLMVVTLSALLCLSVLYNLTKQWLNSQTLKKALAGIPGPKPLPLFGNIFLVRRNADIFPVTKRLYAEFKKSYLIYLGPTPRLIICDQKMAKGVLSSHTIIDKSYDYNYFHDWLGTGLLTSTGEKWKSRRKLLTPTFHFQVLQQFIKTFNEQSDILAEMLTINVDKGPFNIFPYIALCTLDTICEAAMGVKINAQKNSKSSYVLSVQKMCHIITSRASSILEMFDLTYKFTLMYQKQKKALSIIHGFTKSVIQDRKKNVTNKMLPSSDDGVTKRVAFLDLLLNYNLADEAIREEVDTFMFEGHDTTSSGISFTLYNISKNFDVQMKVVEELRAIFNDDNKRVATYHDLNKMKYLEMVIKESLRLYPPVPIFSRVLSQDTMLDGILLPKGLAVSINCFLLHRDPIVFPDPEQFNPDRFLPNNTTERSPYAYVPFSAGSRNCIGQRFAMLEMKSAISKVLRHFELMPVYDHEPELLYEVIMRSNNGLPVRLRKRCF